MSQQALIAALAQALKADPRNGALWLHYADLLAADGQTQPCLGALRHAVEIAAVREQALRKLLPRLREAGELSEALIRAEGYLEQHEDPQLRAELNAIIAARAGEVDAPSPAPTKRVESEPALTADVESHSMTQAQRGGQRHVDANLRANGPSVPPGNDAAEWASQFDWGDLRITLADVAGLDDVKRQIRLRILAPFQKPDIYTAFGRSGGGGLLLYGPPGCGKTFIARATAGELGARFVSVSIHDVLDKYFGDTEKLIHGLFENARRNKPTVLFFDEFDALAAPRGANEAQFWKSMVDQLLSEMDGVNSRNKDVLLLAATNTPWNVDSAFRRPGRFDRVLFVTPPDEAARRQMLTRTLAQIPGGDKVKVDVLVKRTEMYSGADLRALCERASEQALDKSLETGKVHEVSMRDFERALDQVKPSVTEWFASARNYARYSNEGGQYDELAEYLRKVKRW